MDENMLVCDVRDPSIKWCKEYHTLPNRTIDGIDGLNLAIEWFSWF